MEIFINFEGMIRKYSVLLPVICFLSLACSNKYHRFVSNYPFTTATGSPDYSSLDYWAAHPWKWDPSDSVPLPFRENYQRDTNVDVFFIYPTTYTDKTKPFGWNAPIDNAELNAKTDYSSILFQASIFNEAGRVFSPRYRQANYFSYLPITADDTTHAIAAFDLAYQDVKTAFLYYLQNDNNGRPIIIASHSQGSTHGKRLLKEFFDGKELQKKLIAAYLIGMPLEPDYFASIKPCNTPDQTGCAISWRTFKDGYEPSYIQKEKFVSIVTNPLTWDADIPSADRSLNKGAILLNFNKSVKGSVRAKINQGVLWTDKPHFFGNIFYTAKNYHIADMNLFYLNIRENVKLRVVSYKKK
ncbi:MAG: DUF3089 domain-containing protein [Bacteroidota bacterium]